MALWKLSWASALALVLAAGPAMAAAPVMSLDEVDEDGNTTAIAANGQQVDVDSTLHLAISRANLHQRIVQLYGSDGATAHVGRLVLGERAVADATRAAAALGPLLKNDKTGRSPQLLATLNQVNAAVLPLEQALLDQLRRDPGLPEKAELQKLTGGRAIGLFVLAHAPDILRREQAAANASDVYVQVAGSLERLGHTTPLHLPGFDTNAEGQYYEVPRWSYLPSDEQLAALKTSAQQIDRFNQGGADALQAAARDALEAFLKGQGQHVNAAVQRLQALLTADAKTLGADAADVRGQVDQLQGRLAGLRKDLDAALDRLRAPVPATGAADRAGSLIDALEAARKVDGDVEAIAAQLDPLSKRFQDLAAVKQEWLELEQAVGNLADSVEFGTRATSTARATADFNQRVLKLGPAGVPETSTLDLHTAGRRDVGDTVVLSMRAGKGQLAPTDLETRRMRLARVLFHTEPQAGWLLAQNPPAPGTTAFSMAPALGVLFKGGWRGTGAWPFWWNEVLTPGAGISMAALDLRHSGNVEIGLGAEVSLLHDWVQVGEGYDFALGTPYFFVGSQLPLSALQVLMP